ncbi:MAG: S8 family serine peptidase, partial [Ramlibacter sp.]
MATRKAAVKSTRTLDQPVPLESLVIYVHGVGQDDPAAQLKLHWDLALFGRDMGDRSVMAYWADLVRPEVLNVRPASVQRKSLVSNDSVDVDAMLDEARVPPRKREAAQGLAAGLLRQVGVNEVPSAGTVRTKFLPLPAWLRKPISRAFIQALIGDTSAYFFTAGMRAKIAARLKTEIDKAGQRPVTIVAHSQGTIIAYEVLSRLAEDALRLDALVTIGSPLGIQEIQDYLEPNDPLKVPAVVKRWHNFADPIDPVALDKKLGSDFQPTGMIQDDIILNGNTRLQWGFNPHSAAGYLAHPKVRRVVYDAVRMDVLSRFVLARDVAERLGAVPGERHPVLIEVLEPGYQALDETRDRMKTVEKTEQASLKRQHADEFPPLKLEHRIDLAAEKLRKLVGHNAKAARIDPLRRFVAAELTADELARVGAAHQEMRVYAVWRSSSKAKLTGRSMRVLKADAALSSFSADGKDITWAVLDTGIRTDHPHFKDVIKEVWDCTKQGRPVKLPSHEDPDGHGTHVAGIISGRAPEGSQGRAERGAAPRARLVIY